MHDIKMLHGIDSLYYFCESNENYDDLYLEILDQVEEVKGKFEKRDVELGLSDGINVEITDGVKEGDKIKVWNKASKEDNEDEN